MPAPAPPPPSAPPRAAFFPTPSIAAPAFVAAFARSFAALIPGRKPFGRLFSCASSTETRRRICASWLPGMAGHLDLSAPRRRRYHAQQLPLLGFLVEQTASGRQLARAARVLKQLHQPEKIHAQPPPRPSSLDVPPLTLLADPVAQIPRRLVLE